MNSIRILLISLTPLLALTSCDFLGSSTEEISEECVFRPVLQAPPGYTLDTLGTIEFNGRVRSFQFIDQQIGYAQITNNVGGYVEVFKTSDGGQSWTDLNIGINQGSTGMVFKDKDTGIITVHDVSGCPPPNCLNKTILLKTTDGGSSWAEIEIDNLKGVLSRPQLDSQDNLYALLHLGSQTFLMKSTNFGETWEEFYSSQNKEEQAVGFQFRLFNNRAYLSAGFEKILVLDSAANLLNTLSINSSYLRDIEIIDENNLIIVASDKVIKSTDAGQSWTTIHENSAKMIGFDSPENGLMILTKSYCPTDFVQANEVIAFTTNGGETWLEAKQTTTNIDLLHESSQKLNPDSWNLMLDNSLVRLTGE